MGKMGLTPRKRHSTAKESGEQQLRYFAVYKPFGMMSQFSRENDKPTLADLGFSFPKDVYPVGRLDHDSEGLLLLTNDRKANARLLSPANHQAKTYCVQVDRQITPEAVEELQKGVTINVNGAYRTKPCKARIIAEPTLPERVPPIRYRANVPTSWVEITITEGKNRQVRKMTAAVGFPTLRLVRTSIGSIKLMDMQPGDVVELSKPF